MATKTIVARAYMRGSKDPITDQDKGLTADYWTMPVSVMDADVFADALTKANVKVEFMGKSKLGKAHVAYREGYREHYGLDNDNTVGLPLQIPA